MTGAFFFMLKITLRIEVLKENGGFPRYNRVQWKR